MSDLGDRIKEAAALIGGLDKLQPHLSDVSRRTLSDYVAGKSEPKASTLMEIVDATGVAITWLMSGHGARAEKEADEFKPDGRISSSMLVSIHSVVQRVYDAAGLRLPEHQALEIVAAAYNDFISDNVDMADEEEVALRVALLERKLQKQIDAAKAEPGTGKRSA